MNEICSQCCSNPTELMRQLCGIPSCPKDIVVTELNEEEVEIFFSTFLSGETQSKPVEAPDPSDFWKDSKFRPL